MKLLKTNDRFLVEKAIPIHLHDSLVRCVSCRLKYRILDMGRCNISNFTCKFCDTGKGVKNV